MPCDIFDCGYLVGGEGAIPNLKGRDFLKESGFFGPLFFFYLPAWNVNLGPREIIVILP